MANSDLETNFSFPVQTNGTLASGVEVNKNLINAIVQAVMKTSSETVKKLIITFIQSEANVRIISAKNDTLITVEKFKSIAEIYNKAISDIESSSFSSSEMKQEAINTITQDYSNQIAKLLRAGQKDNESKEPANIFYPPPPTTNYFFPSISIYSSGQLIDGAKSINDIVINPFAFRKIDVIFSENSERRLTPEYLSNTVNPYLIAIADIQHIWNSINGKRDQDVTVKSISQNSPISVSLDGAAQAMQTIVDYVVPSKRKIADEIVRLSISDKQVEIESKRAEVLEKRARATKDRAESEKLLAEVDTQKAETEKLQLENEKLRLELQQAKIQMAMDVLQHIAPNLSEIEKVEYLLRLLPPLEVVIHSNLEVQIK